MEKMIVASRGCLLGMAVGDAMGYPVDKKSWDEICEDYGPNGLLGYDLVNGSADITSYTQMAAFVCNGLLLGILRGNPEKLSRYIGMSLREWAKSQQFRGGSEKTYCWLAQVPEMRRRHCMDTRMLDALSREVLGTPEAPVFQSAFPGAVTAAVGVGLAAEAAHLSKEQILRLGAESVAFTHGDPEAFLSGAFLAYSIAAILEDPQAAPAKHFLAAAQAVKDYFSERWSAQANAISAKIDRAIALTKDPELSALASMSLLGCTTAAECVAGAVYACLIHLANFDEAMIAAVNHSGRSAAVGAITGALLGARLGVDALPDFYLESLEAAPPLQELAEDIIQSKQVLRIFDDSWDQKYVQGIPAH